MHIFIFSFSFVFIYYANFTSMLIFLIFWDSCRALVLVRLAFVDAT